MRTTLTLEDDVARALDRVRKRRGETLKQVVNQALRRAALALEHGLTLASTDGDFARFGALRWENPLAGAG